MGRPGIALALALAAGSAHAQVQVTSPLPGVRLAVAVNNGNPSALLVVDLCAPGVTVRTTRYDERGALAADWAARTGVDLAVNGDLFDFGAYSVAHWARSGGVDWPPGTHNQEPHPNIAFGPGLAMRGDVPPPSAANDVIGGIPEILIDGALNPSLADTDFINGPHRRTAAPPWASARIAARCSSSPPTAPRRCPVSPLDSAFFAVPCPARRPCGGPSTSTAAALRRCGCAAPAPSSPRRAPSPTTLESSREGAVLRRIARCGMLIVR